MIPSHPSPMACIRGRVHCTECIVLCADADEKHSVSTYALKWFFTVVSVGLIASTVIGIWMGTTQIRRKGLAWTLLIAGTLVPIGLLVI